MVDASASEALEVKGTLTDYGTKTCSFLQHPPNTLFIVTCVPGYGSNFDSSSGMVPLPTPADTYNFETAKQESE